MISSGIPAEEDRIYVRLYGPEFFKYLSPAFSGHYYIKQHKIYLYIAVCEYIDCFLSVFCFNYSVSIFFEQFFYDFSGIFIIVRYKYCFLSAFYCDQPLFFGFNIFFFD